MTRTDLPPSLVLAADDPERLAGFYAALLETPVRTGLSPSHWRLAWPGGGLLEIYRPSRQRPIPRGGGRLALCLLRPAAVAEPLDALQIWYEQVLVLGALALEPPRQESFGAEAWVADPEQNRLLLLVSGA
jgi:hypothetical protein